MNANREGCSVSEFKLRLAKRLVHLAWGSGDIPAILDVEYEGAQWEVIVRVKDVEDGSRILPGHEADYVEKLPE